MYTRFFDMHSGGDRKLDWGVIYIEAPKKEAITIFRNRFDRDPNNITCPCCGGDYSIHETESTKDFCGGGVLIISAEEIKI